MKSNRAAQSFFKLSIQTIRLLTPDQRKGAIKNIIFSFVVALLEVISLTAIFPLLYQIIKYSQSPDTGSAITRYMNLLTSSLSWYTILIAVVILFLLKNITSLWAVRYQSRFVNKLYITFSEQFYQRFYRQSWIDYLQENSAEIFRKIKNTPYDFSNQVINGYLQVITESLICLLMIGVVSWIDYRIVYVLIGLSIPIILFYYFFRKNIISKIDRSFRDHTPKANIMLGQGIDCFAEAKIYQKEKFFIRKFIEVIKITSSQLASLHAFANLPSRILETLGIICFALCILIGKLFPDYQHTLLLLLALLSVSMYRILPSLNKILISLSQIQAYAYSVSELKFGPTNTLLQSREIKTITFEDSIQFKNVSFHYTSVTDNPLLQNLNFSISKGDFVILEGPSGVGKTTLIHLLAGLIPGYTGEFSVDNYVLSSESLQSWQHNLGLVPQAPIVLQDTLLKNIAFGEDENTIDMQQAKNAIELAGIHHFIMALPLQLNTPVGENGLTLSGGQRQRLILARALYRNPKILLLDEVTNQLDEDNKLKILNTLQSLTQRGSTVILASHDAVVKTYATRIFRLEKNGLYDIQVV
ncbi:MAG TPA: ABC transporter ATP-binding protein [Cyclobacteriaceae bacterium]